MIRTLILVIVLFFIGATIAINNNIKTRNDYKTTQNIRPVTIQQDSTNYIHFCPNREEIHIGT